MPGQNGDFLINFKAIWTSLNGRLSPCLSSIEQKRFHSLFGKDSCFPKFHVSDRLSKFFLQIHRCKRRKKLNSATPTVTKVSRRKMKPCISMFHLNVRFFFSYFSLEICQFHSIFSYVMALQRRRSCHNEFFRRKLSEESCMFWISFIFPVIVLVYVCTIVEVN